MGAPWGVLQLWVLGSQSPGIRENQRPPPLSVQLPLAVCQSSCPMGHDTCPNASFRIRGRQRPIAEPQRSGVRMGQKPVQGYAKTRHLDSRESEAGASVPGHSSTARVKNSGSPGRWLISRWAGGWVRKRCSGTPSMYMSRARTEWVDLGWALPPVVGLPCCRPAACDSPCDGTLISSPQRWFSRVACEGVLPLERAYLDPKLPLSVEVGMD